MLLVFGDDDDDDDDVAAAPVVFVTQKFWFPTFRRNVVPPSSAVRETNFSTSFHFLHLISFKVGTGKVITVLN